MITNENQINPEPRKKVAQTLAKNLLKDADITSAPVSLRTVIEHLQLSRNLEILGSDSFGKKVSGLLIICVKEGEEFSTIGFNENHPWCRRRFTIAHEIGHLLLRHSCSSGDGSQNETEANIFAAELLMPKTVLMQDFSECEDIPTLSKKYLVSSQALTIKLLEERIVKY